MDSAHQPSMNSYVANLIWKHSSDAIFALDQQGAVIETNAAFLELMGYEAEQLRNESFPPFIVDMTEEEHRHFLKKLKQGQHFPYEIVKRKSKEGEYLDILASYWPVNDENILAVGMYKDFSEQMKIQKKLEKSEYYYRTLVEHLPEAIIWQRYDEIHFINAAGCEFFGVENRENVLNRSIWNFISSEKEGEIRQMIDSIYEADANIDELKTIIAPLTKRAGEKIWTEVKVIAIGDKDEPNVQIVFRDVTEKWKYENSLKHLAYHDPLTGLKNRRGFADLVNETIQKAEGTKERFAILYLDIDDFKLINDTFGHDAGDQVLKTFAKRIDSAIRNVDVPCRVGGDEFLVLLRNMENDEQLKQAISNLQRAFKQPYAIEGQTLHVTCSIGSATFPENGQSLRTLIIQADLSLYRMKDAPSKS